MGEKVSRREALVRMGGGVLAAGALAVSGIDRLAYAVSRQASGGHYRARDNNRCPGPVNFGCEMGYNCNPYDQFNCTNFDHACEEVGFGTCEAGDKVYCEGDGGEFRCYHGDDGSFGCTTRTFYCGDRHASGFVCGNGQAVEGSRHFFCRVGETFFCDETSELFDCNPDSEYNGHYCV